MLAPGAGDADRAVLAVLGEAGVGKTHLCDAAIPAAARLASVSFPHTRFTYPGFGLRRLAELAGGAGHELMFELEDSQDDAPRGKLYSIVQKTDDLLRSSPERAVVFDDIQWADELTLSWISQTTTVVEQAAARILLLVRTPDRLPPRVAEAVAPLVRQQKLETLQLDPLTPQAVAQLVREQGFARATELATELHRLTGGLPLVLQEVLKELHRDGQSLDSIRAAPPRRALEVVESIVREQANDLPEDAAHLLAICCLVPQRPAERVVRLVAGWSSQRFDRGLEAALSSGLIKSDDKGGLTFRHELHREALQSLIPMPARRELHRQIAAALSGDPEYPAGPIGDQLVEAGLVDEALEWLERAAVESGRAHDHGNALTYLGAAIDLCSDDQSETRVRLCGRVVAAARCNNEPEAGREMVEGFLSRTGPLRHRGFLSLYLGRLASYAGDYETRFRAMNDALDAFERIEDDRGQALVLGELTFPIGGALSLRERIAMGTKGLAIAESIGDEEAIALCAVNLADAKYSAGQKSAFALWARAGAHLKDARTGPLSEMAMRNQNNWALAALSYGNYEATRQVVSDGLSWCREPFWARSLHAANAILLWRTGEWDKALRQIAEVKRGIARPQVAAIADVVEGAIRFERDRQPEISNLSQATESLLAWGDDEWGPLAMAVLVRVRAARRMPWPGRGLSRATDLVLNTGVRTGWDDLLPVIAEHEPTMLTRIPALLDAQRPLGRRAAASCAWAQGLLAAGSPSLSESERLLGEAADRFQSLPEPFSEARALEHLAEVRLRSGKRVADLRTRAAELYSDLGAHRSLARLIRRSKGSSAMSRFKIPPSQRGASSPGLTPREQDVATLAAEGNTINEIARELGIATGTVKKHLDRVRIKLGVRRKSELVRLLNSVHAAERTSDRVAGHRF